MEATVQALLHTRLNSDAVASSKMASCVYNKLFRHCLRLSSFPTTWKESKVVNPPKTEKYSKFLQNLRSISFLFSTGKVFEKLILRTIQKDFGGTNLLKANQFLFGAGHSPTLHCMRLADHVTLN
jgi:hypothetical protein